MIFPDTSYSLRTAFFGAREELTILISGILGICLILTSFILMVFLKVRFASLIGILGCLFIGINLCTFLFVIWFMPYIPSLGFYLNYFTWIGFCIITLFLFKYKGEIINAYNFSFRKNELYLQYSKLFPKINYTYFIFVVLFLISIIIPFMHLFDYSPPSGYPGVQALTIGGIEGIPLIIISIIYLDTLKIRKAIIYGLLGSGIISINFFLVIPTFGGLFIPSIGFYLSFISWLGFLIINFFLLKFKKAN
ncbi:MAG: hypothetical protein ACFFA7_15230 [Promethearchaeota archaeon]